MPDQAYHYHHQRIFIVTELEDQVEYFKIFKETRKLQPTSSWLPRKNHRAFRQEGISPLSWHPTLIMVDGNSLTLYSISLRLLEPAVK